MEDVDIVEITRMMVTVKAQQQSPSPSSGTSPSAARELPACEVTYADPGTGKSWGEIIDSFAQVSTIEDTPKIELCSFCWCGHRDNTTIPDSPLILPDPSTSCQTDEWYTTVEGDTCDFAQMHDLAPASLYLENPDSLHHCFPIAEGTSLCLPPSCPLTWTIQPSDTWFTTEYNVALSTMVAALGNIKYSRWVDRDCRNLHSASDGAFGHVICLAPQNGDNYISSPPEGATVAQGTTIQCGKWHVAAGDDTCSSIAFSRGTTIGVFMEVNLSLGTVVL
ncbi:hypothetical protein NKR23_g758 [Pleurostoma richardsiae]|uniref:LysM domain-containing protein n=1 Tax=Pleurostoma richardsiae TaxID=41990 RepID=A0AA38VL77_9PEZI|nr:hypothetical protein NKR23_g758 [Pleurostoma richardsiae]